MSVSEAHSIEIDGKTIEIWPDGLEIEGWLEPVVNVVKFDDTEDFHRGLIAKIRDLEDDASSHCSSGSWTAMRPSST